MNILAINTAFNQSYVGLNYNKKQYLKNVDSALKQSENILFIISNVLNEANAKVNDLDAVACVIGPGSFTGIRIGVGLCKGFCVACNNIKKIEVNSLDLLAYTHSKVAKDNFYVVLNALGGNLFVCKYDKNGKQLTQPYLLNEETKFDYEVVGLTDENLGFCNHFEEFSSNDLLEYSLLLCNQNCFSNTLTPVYLRKSQAEAELDKKSNNQT